MTLTGFDHPWYFLFGLIVLGLIVLYIATQAARRTMCGSRAIAPW